MLDQSLHAPPSRSTRETTAALASGLVPGGQRAAGASATPDQPLPLSETPLASVAILGDDTDLHEVRELAAAAEVSLLHIRPGQLAHHAVALSTLSALRDVSPRHTRHLTELVVLTDAATTECFETALRHRATKVVALPSDAEWLLAYLVTLGEHKAATSRVIGVLGGCSGAGASALASAIALSATSQTLLIDADPLSGGLDLLLGIEDHDGMRWDNLRAATGALPTATILAALPALQRVRVLSFGRTDNRRDWADSAVSTTEALCAGVSTCVIDLSREHAVTPSLAGICHEIYVIVPRHVRALAASLHVLNDDLQHLPLHIITRGPSPSGITPADVAAYLDREVRGDYTTSPRQETRFVRGIERGYGPLLSSGASTRRLARTIALSPLSPGRMA